MDCNTLIILLVAVSCFHTGFGLSCLDGWSFNGNQTIDKKTTCNVKETLCFNLHTKDENRIDIKSCWDPTWEDHRYDEVGCIIGQHCLMGECYENATACVCDTDNCNSFDLANNETWDTPIPYPPTTPSELHSCYYGVMEEGAVSTMTHVEECLEGEQLCVVVTQSDDQYEYRSCWGGWDIDYSRPGCYEGFEHCHHGHCHNDTLICVCAENKCNTPDFSSVAPPITPGSGLYCYQGEGIEIGHDPVACKANQDFCIYVKSNAPVHDGKYFEKRDCWDHSSMEGEFNFTGCESGQHCMWGDCHDSTVCLCQDNMCNGVEINNVTVSSPWPKTTAAGALRCWYGHKNATVAEEWQHQICLPEEVKCVTFWTDTKDVFAGCYDPSWDDNHYENNDCYNMGQTCRDGICYNATICVCEEENCNDPKQTTEKPIETTPGSGLKCWYGIQGGHHHADTNVTEQICDRNETLCIQIDSEDGFSYRTCHDPHDDGGEYKDPDTCYDGLHCWTWDDSGHQDCANGTVCTCNTNLCNGKNSTTPPPVTKTTNKNSHQCWFGEQHPGMTETWEVETCTSDQPYCFQLISQDRKFESRECWSLEYEDQEYSAPGCYRGKHCHHEHCFHDITVCICEGNLCNDWTDGGNVTTEVPVTSGSGLLCYEGDYDADAGQSSMFTPHFCSKGETMCSYFSESGGRGWVAAGCYNPDDDNSQYDTEGCYDNVVVEHHDRAPTGQFCVCGGAKDGSDDLCNKNYFGNGGTRIDVSIILILALSLLLCQT